MQCERGPSILTPPGEEWPLLFKHTFDVRGSDFEAMVTIDGALLATITDGHCWLDGVYPYEVAGGDESLSQAYENLKVFLAGVLADIAEESTNFGEFEKKVHVFAKHPGDRRALEAWKRAVQKVRAGGANVPDIKSRDSAGWTPSVIAVEISSETTETILLPAVVANAPLRGELAA
jgi:hypothetical protein